MPPGPCLPALGFCRSERLYRVVQNRREHVADQDREHQASVKIEEIADYHGADTDEDRIEDPAELVFGALTGSVAMKNAPKKKPPPSKAVTADGTGLTPPNTGFGSEDHT